MAGVVMGRDRIHLALLKVENPVRTAPQRLWITLVVEVHGSVVGSHNGRVAVKARFSSDVEEPALGNPVLRPFQVSALL
jgi:hypothetical protein